MFSCEKAVISNLRLSELSGQLHRLSGEYQGKFNCYFYQSRGIFDLFFNGDLLRPEISFEGLFPEINLKQLCHDLNDQVIVSGIVKTALQGKLSPGQHHLVVTFESLPRFGVKQTLNFGAVKALAALGGGGSVRAITGADFHYSKMAGSLSLINGYLTLEGLAGRHGQYQYLLRSRPLGQGINVFVDPGMNTIRLEYFLGRLQDAISRQGKVDLK
ncbi:MAG TPA: hypothetical protein PKW42_05115 [bacterium]|nr:hypothetical protein [bacterium]